MENKKLNGQEQTEERFKKILKTGGIFGDDFKQVIFANEALQEIIGMAIRLNDAADFGVNVAYILKKYKLLDNAIFEILTGEI